MAARSKVAPRRRPRQARSKDTVDAILTAAPRVLERHGLAGFTTARVAEVAGVSVGTLNQYNPSQEAILAAIIGDVTVSSLTAIQRALDAALAVPLATAIGPTCALLVAAFDSVRPRVQGALDEARGAVGQTAAFRTHVAQVVIMLRDHLAARRHELRISDVDAAAFLIVNGADGIAVGLGHDRAAELARPALVAAMTDLLRRYLVAEPAAKT
jgi:AcrR family transcriptional regulator